MWGPVMLSKPPVPLVWLKNYTTTLQGQSLKFVPCEGCSTEYVYLMQREGTGVGTSLYSLNNKGAAEHAKSAAKDTLASILENDFDPVPCPACGHYQRYMFPKMQESKRMPVLIGRLALIGCSCVALLATVRFSIDYLNNGDDQSFWNMIASCAALLVLILLGLSLWILSKRRPFNPNLQDQQARIALGQSRAVTRAEFDKSQQENKRGNKSGR
jgi:hypothetical protein